MITAKNIGAWFAYAMALSASTQVCAADASAKTPAVTSAGDQIKVGDEVKLTVDAPIFVEYSNSDSSDTAPSLSGSTGGPRATSASGDTTVNGKSAKATATGESV